MSIEGRVLVNSQTKDYYESRTDEEDQMQPPESFAMRFYFRAEAGLPSRFNLFDVRALPSLPFVI